MPKSNPLPIPISSSNSSSSSPSLPPCLTSPLPLPSLIVFDLDYTLWPFWVDTHVSPPLKPLSSSTITPTYTHAARDKHGEEFSFYSSVPALLSALHAHPDTTVAAASRTQAPELAREMLRLLQIPSFAIPVPQQPPSASDDASSSSARKSKAKAKAGAGAAAGAAADKPRKAIEFFSHLEIYPGSKKKHFARLREVTGVEYEEMLFFDDERRNREVESLGVTMWLVPDGLDGGGFERGVQEWRRRRGGSGEGKK